MNNKTSPESGAGAHTSIPDTFEFFVFPDSARGHSYNNFIVAGNLFNSHQSKKLNLNSGHQIPATSDDERNHPHRLWGVATMKGGYRRLRTVPESYSKPATSPPSPARSSRQRPRWHLCVLGAHRIPSTMDLNEIKSRQRRRSPASDASPATSYSGGPWRLIRSLSCRGVESADVITAPLRV